MDSTGQDQALESLPHLLRGLEGHSCLLYEHIFISKAGMKAAQTERTPHNMRKGLSMRNGVLLFQQLHCSESCKNAASATIHMLSHCNYHIRAPRIFT